MTTILKFYLFCFLAGKCKGIHLNESVYKSMPTLFLMDDYEDCDFEPLGYCVADFQLFSNSQSELMNVIQNYSSDIMKHFDHTLIHRGVCLSKTCKSYHLYTSNKEADPESILGACVNQTIWDRYGIEAKIKSLHYCKHKDRIKLDVYDIAVALVYAVIIFFVALGTAYDFYQTRNQGKKDNQYLMAFSLKQNWKKLVAPAGVGPDPRLSRLKLINGLRAMTMAYDDLSKHILFNGTLVVHTFFAMSSFLLAYNLQIYSEKHKLSWTQIPKAIILRWLRLTPPYALIIATISTWMRHFGDGPLWPLLVLSETQQCRQYWWSNIFYFNNYYYQSCFPIGWYLAADFQLFCTGIILLVFVHKTCRRIIALSLLLIVSFIITASHTYFENLNAIVIQSPETYRSIYVYDMTYRRVYIGGHTNLSSYTIGLAGGLLTYYWQNSNFDARKYKKYRWLLWIQFPLAVLIILSGMIFYITEPPTLLRVLYATFYKPLFVVMVVNFMVASVFKLEPLYRPIVEWRGWTWAGRVSYSVFLLHTVYQRAYVGAQLTPIHLSDYHVLILLCSSLLLSLLSGVVLWLTVEAPVAALTRIIIKTGSNK
ncbi:O-acyltransferase like protein-like isoform X2 [Aricia agestis]|uniref:O-acyltransferase like protein-like isoform X2 n=1 Tax=Aricia agestis TaxID=91739 RepID=UPI001C208257|nr:O-acyltransferase like protein-like isoform X2 [Aricia agestis]